MDDHKESSDSDSSDEDYVPEAERAPPSEDESDPDCQEDGGSGDEEKINTKRKKGRPIVKRARKKLKSGEEVAKTVDESPEYDCKPINEEEKKKRDEALWADFMKDCGPSVKQGASSTSSKVNTDLKTDEKENNSETSEPVQKTTKKITQIFEFAGEKIEVEKEVDEDTSDVRNAKTAGSVDRGGGRGPRGRGGGGLSAVLGMIGKKGKLTTLEKSKLDWEKFKTQEGIQEDIQTHNKGKNGFLEKQDFLQRSDLRQFELEKEMRSSRRSNR